MSLFDWIIITILVFFVIRSIIRGAAREIFSLLAFFLAGVSSAVYYPAVIPFLQSRIADSHLRVLAAIVGLFVFVYCSVVFAGWVVSKMIKAAQLTALDRIAGALIGSVKAYGIVCCIIVCLMLVPRGEQILAGSFLCSYSYAFISYASQLIPSPLKETIQGKISRLQKQHPSQTALRA